MFSVEDTFCEAFDGLFARLLVTCADRELLRQAAFGSTALPCTVFGESEGGVESWVEDTPDGRPGALIQVWVNRGKNASKVLEAELGKRIRQGILVVPGTRVFNALESGLGMDTMERIGHCGDGFETVETRFGREVINVPIMAGEFLIERFLGFGEGVMGANLWFYAQDLESGVRAGKAALAALEKVEGVVAPFGICSAGSKPETNYPEIGPTTNHPYCPTLKGKITDSRVPEGVHSIPEIVIDGVSLEAVKQGMEEVIRAVRNLEGILGVSAGNYGGKLGSHRIYLKSLDIDLF